jgi:hypothetical protein
MPARRQQTAPAAAAAADVLRRTLRSLGYVAETWGQGFNLGPRSGVLEGCADDASGARRWFFGTAPPAGAGS